MLIFTFMNVFKNLFRNKLLYTDNTIIVYAAPVEHHCISMEENSETTPIRIESENEQSERKKSPLVMKRKIAVSGIVLFIVLSGFVMLIKNKTIITAVSSNSKLAILRGLTDSTDFLKTKFDPETPVNNVGFKNSGNSCFFNAAMQAIYHDHEIRRVVAQLQASSSMASKLAALFTRIDSAKENSVIDPKMTSFLPAYLLDGEQQDAAEALDAVLERIVDEGFVIRCQSQIEYIYTDERMPKISTAVEPMKMLQLSLDSQKPQAKKNKGKKQRDGALSQTSYQLQNLIDNFFNVETIPTENYQRAEGIESIRKQYQLLNHPQTLIIHLKRQTYSPQTGLGKNHASVVANETVTLPRGINYRLKSFIYHEGSFSGGHYYTYVTEGSTFTLFDDSIVKKSVDVRSKLNTGYIYFYERLEEYKK